MLDLRSYTGNMGNKLSAQEVLADFRKKEILDAARQLITSVGFSGLTMEKVADKAGVAKGTIYTYFKDKDTLIKKVLVSSSELMLSNLETSVQDSKEDKTFDRLLSAAMILEEFSRENDSLLKYIHLPDDYSDAIKSPKVDSAKTKIITKVSLLIASIFQDGIEKGELIESNPNFLCFLFLESIYSVVIAEDRIPEMEFNAEARDIVEFFMNGILKNRSDK